MTPYILVFCIHVSVGCAPATAEFVDLPSCEAAKVQIATEVRRVNSYSVQLIFATCIRKDSR